MIEIKLFQIAKYSDGQILAVQAPPVTKGAMEVRFLHQELRTVLATEEKLWPLDDGLATEICDRHRPFLQAIAAHLRPALDLDRMVPEEQFYWFIASEPEQVGDRLLLGLSHVEHLIGIQRQIIDDSEGAAGHDTPELEEDFVEGTGDVLLDLISDAHLVFKSSAKYLLANFSPGACQRMLIYASRRKAQAMERMKSEARGVTVTATHATDPVESAVAHSLPPQVQAALKTRGIDTP